MSFAVQIWWAFLGLVSLINVAAWFYSARVFREKVKGLHPGIVVWRKAMLWLSALYVAGCGFRSFFPRVDLERLCLVDSWLSSMLVGRSVATVAELCFMAQCAILLREAGKGAGDRVAVMVAFLLMPMITVAEGFSWYAVITTHYLGSVLEESLWALAGVLLVVSFLSMWSKVTGAQRHFLTFMTVFGVGFVLFMVLVDVPMYWVRWQADAAMAKSYLSLGQGLLDAAGSCRVTFDWGLWKQEVPWMTLYFTVAVWVSLYLPHAPGFRRFQNGPGGAVR